MPSTASTRVRCRLTAAQSSTSMPAGLVDEQAQQPSRRSTPARRPARSPCRPPPARPLFRGANKKWAEAHRYPKHQKTKLQNSSALKLLKYNRIPQLTPASRREIARAARPARSARAPAGSPGGRPPRRGGAPRGCGLPSAPPGTSGWLPSPRAVGLRCARIAPARRPSSMPASSCFFSAGLQLAADPGGVLALELVARVHQPVGELAGVGEEQQPRAIEVQPADCNPPARRQRGTPCAGPADRCG